ncbi:MAG: glycosyltransferase family 8 protein, partial [Clostridia bacterium]|nr:glycosyltransferase family 8 protein [Clostridia bacterium]
KKHGFETIAPDQDYLNYLCKGRVKYLPSGWDEMPVPPYTDAKELHLIHFNMFLKPWRYDVEYGEYFWKYAVRSPFFEEILKEKTTYTDAEKKRDKKGEQALLKMAERITRTGKKFALSDGEL